jgi:hypothetical protein
VKVTLDQLIETWKQDAPVDSTELVNENFRIPNLHSKYAAIRATHRQIVRALQKDHAKLKLLKNDYYTGKLSREELKERGWDPFQRTLLNAEVTMHLNADDDLSASLFKISTHEEIVDLCDLIIKEINNRTWQFKSAIQLICQLKGHM